MESKLSKNKLLYIEILGIGVTVGMSFIIHFLYEWLWYSPYIAWLGATNESVWEHGKIIFYPYLIYAILEYLLIRPKAVDNFITAKCIPLTAMIPLMITLFYTYTGILGSHILWLDILMTIAILAISFLYSYTAMQYSYSVRYPVLLLASAMVITTLIVIFTYYPPEIPLFIPQQ